MGTIFCWEILHDEAFLDQEDEGAPELPDQPDPEDDALEDGVIVARPAPSIHDKPNPKRKGKDQKGNDKGKGQGKRADSRGTRHNAVSLHDAYE